jgi:DNA-binding MarR family transcriptional regulator
MPDDHSQRIVQALQQTAWPRDVASLAAQTGLPQPLVVKALDRLRGAGLVERVARGLYRMPGAGD